MTKQTKKWQNPVVYIDCGKTRNPLSINPNHAFQMFIEKGELKIVTNIKDWYYEDCSTTYFLTTLLDQGKYYHEMVGMYKKLRDEYAYVNSINKNNGFDVY